MATFWSTTTPGTRDPKRQFRWIMTIGSIPAYVLKKATKPSFTVEESEHKYLNHTYYYPGRVTWNSIEVTLADPVDPDIAGTIVNIIKAGGYSPATSQLHTTTMSKSAAVNALGDQIEIVQIDAEGGAVETWKLQNPWIKDVKFGELDYEGDDLTDVTIELRYDWASLTTEKEPVKGSKISWQPGSTELPKK